MQRGICFVDRSVDSLAVVSREVRKYTREIDLAMIPSIDRSHILADAAALVVGHRLRDGTPVQMLITHLHVLHPHVSVFVVVSRDAAVRHRLAELAHAGVDHVVLPELRGEIQYLWELVRRRVMAPPPEVGIRTRLRSEMRDDVRRLIAFALRAGFHRQKVEQVAQHFRCERRRLHRLLKDAGLPPLSVILAEGREMHARFLEESGLTKEGAARRIGLTEQA
jgi:AraC-like DNA-binding protein